ncbi:MAG: hypothetical protein ACQXXE_08750, partial [Candidatus Bathyarchaeia archaeon]
EDKKKFEDTLGKKNLPPYLSVRYLLSGNVAVGEGYTLIPLPGWLGVFFPGINIKLFNYTQSIPIASETTSDEKTEYTEKDILNEEKMLYWCPFITRNDDMEELADALTIISDIVMDYKLRPTTLRFAHLKSTLAQERENMRKMLTESAPLAISQAVEELQKKREKTYRRREEWMWKIVAAASVAVTIIMAVLVVLT